MSSLGQRVKRLEEKHGEGVVIVYALNGEDLEAACARLWIDPTPKPGRTLFLMDEDDAAL